MIATDLGHPAAAAWLRVTFEAGQTRRNRIDAATWNAIRARGLIVGPPSRLIAEAVRGAVDQDVARLRLALYSPTGQSNSKAACFVFAHGAPRPALVVKAMPEPRHRRRLEHETKIVESIRNRLGPSSRAAAALPLRPLFAGTAADDYVVVQPIDPLAEHTGRLHDSAALAWLRDFQEGTTSTVRAWDDVDMEAALDSIQYAWRRARSASAAALIARSDGLLRALRGQSVCRCAVHGDFWRGNIAQGIGQLRIYDWEWAEDEGTPFFDLWTFELGVLRKKAEEDEAELVQLLLDAIARVSAELQARGFDRRFALATLAPSLARLAFRVRRATGVPGGSEAESIRLMEAAEELLA